MGKKKAKPHSAASRTGLTTQKLHRIAFAQENVGIEQMDWPDPQSALLKQLRHFAELEEVSQIDVDSYTHGFSSQEELKIRCEADIYTFINKNFGFGLYVSLAKSFLNSTHNLQLPTSIDVGTMEPVARLTIKGRDTTDGVSRAVADVETVLTFKDGVERPFFFGEVKKENAAEKVLKSLDSAQFSATQQLISDINATLKDSNGGLDMYEAINLATYDLIVEVCILSL